MLTLLYLPYCTLTSHYAMVTYWVLCAASRGWRIGNYIINRCSIFIGLQKMTTLRVFNEWAKLQSAGDGARNIEPSSEIRYVPSGSLYEYDSHLRLDANKLRL